jgi:uncharacterized protein YcbX
MSARIARISRYPVKGLAADDLEETELRPDEPVPHDRRFAIMHGASTFDPAAPQWKPKTNFLMLMRDERLAALDTEFDAATATLTIRRQGRTVARGRIDTPTGRTLIDQFFAAYMKDEMPGPFRTVEVPGHMFSDIAAKAVSLINIASARDIERVARSAVDPRRFRGNLQIDGLAAWAEVGWVGRTLRVGPDVVLEVFKTIQRCAATEVNPDTAQRDLNVPKLLRAGFGHVECGIYARVTQGGRIAVGDAITVAEPDLI